MGAIAGGGVALWFGESDSSFAMPLMLLGGRPRRNGLGCYSGVSCEPDSIPTKFSSRLMLVYISQLMLSWLVHGPWRDPQGQNYPQSQGFGDAETMSVAHQRNAGDLGYRLRLGAGSGIAWVFSQKTFAGFRMQVAGLAPAAAAYAGFSEKRNIWIALMLCGATAGLAGICEVAGPIGRLQQQISPGYGFRGDHRRLDRAAASDRRGRRRAVDVAALPRR